jgi:polyhydroxyalkanoate synthase
MRETSLENYMLDGVLEAVNAARDITKAPHVHLTGYCIGGTIVSALMAWLNHPDNKEKSPVAHWSLLASLADFGNPGEIEVFIDEEGVERVEKLMEEKGYLDGNDMAMSFRLLRSNNLIWHYFVNNYLCGQEPDAFDVLFWNMDTTRMPEAMHKFYLRELYQENKLAQKGALTLGGRDIDLSRIEQPLYSVGTEQDHIVPWKESFKTVDLVSGPVRYVLATSGHILGIVTPPVEPPKRRYWASDVEKGVNVDSWLEQTEKVPGSWWEDWINWLAPQSGKKQAAPKKLGNADHKPLADAPGTYVLEK